ncbi:transmembrane protein 125 [Antennarius striatus]|uniref:transmembrane protein 125 n=1 Tax=Antennarius striatus TaxID=241820 RepID=UPI0035B1BD04
MQTSSHPPHAIVLEDQVELWWSRDPRRSLLCYCTSVGLVLGLGLGGVGVLSGATGASGEWRLGVGATLCLLALVVLLKQLLSSAVQDMNCVRSRRRIDQLRSGGGADPALMAAVGVAVVICGTALLLVATVGGGGGRNSREMLASSLVLMGAGVAMATAVGGYSVLIYLKRRREQRRRMMMMMVMRTNRARRMRRVFSISGQMNATSRAASSSRTSLI